MLYNFEMLRHILPDEVTMLIDAHVHIEKGSYTVEWVNEFVRAAIGRGLTAIHLLEHSHRFREFSGIYEDVVKHDDYQKNWLDRKMKLSLDDYKDFVSDMRKREFPVKIRFGLEVCYVEGKEQITKEALDDFDWDFVTGSVHWIDGWGFDHKKKDWSGIDVDRAYGRYYGIMKNLVKSDLFDTVAHPDSIKCFGYNASFDLRETYREIADLLNEFGMSAEQNSGLHYRYGHEDLGMNEAMYGVFKERKVRICTASDAHKPEDTGKYIKELLSLR